MSGRHLGHLGDDAAAFVDGVLDVGDRDRALAHLAGCPDCRAAVAEQRQVKALLAGLAAPEVPPGLADRLRAVALEAAVLGVDEPAGPTQPPTGPALRPTRRRVAVRAGTGAVVVGTVAAAVATLAAGVTGRSVPPASVTPPVQRFAVEHAATTRGIPVSAPGLHLSSSGVTGGVAPGLPSAPGTVSWTLPGSAADR